MGEAKRRKINDPNYGKVKNSNKPYKLLPDYGQYHIDHFYGGRLPIHMYVENPGIMVTPVEGYISFESHGCMGTIITSRSKALSYINRPFQGTIIVSPDERFLTRETKEWVIPFRIVEEMN